MRPIQQSLAVALAGAALGLAAPSALANSYTPPNNRAFHGVSETGNVDHYKSFVEQTGEHSAVSQSFFHWGVPLGTGALQRYR